MRDQITAHTIASEVRMRRTQHNGTFLLVEGPSDKRVFRNLTLPDACRIVIGHGWERASEVAAILYGEGFPGMLTVLDADFRRLDNALPPSGILLTDFHDLECMMFASPALAKLLGEYVEDARLAAFEQNAGCSFPETLVRGAAKVGYLRWLSLRQNLGLKFEGLEFQKFVDKDDLSVNQQKLIDAVKNHSQRHEIATKVIVRDIESLVDTRHDLWQLCCGHDLVEMLTVALRRSVEPRRARG